jgi:type VI protein secretion system component VasK
LRYEHASDIAVDLVWPRQEVGVSWAGSAAVIDAVAAGVAGRQSSRPASTSAAPQTPPPTSQVAPAPPQPPVREPMQQKRPCRRTWIAVAAALALLVLGTVLVFFLWNRAAAAQVVETVIQLTDDGEAKDQ